MQGDCLVDLAIVLSVGGAEAEAAGTFREALDRYEAKENTVSAARAREEMAAHLRGVA